MNIIKLYWQQPAKIRFILHKEYILYTLYSNKCPLYYKLSSILN